MSKQDRQKLNILIVLLIVFGLIVVMGYRMSRPPTALTVQTAEPRTSQNPPDPGDASIRLDLVGKEENAEDIGRRDIFVYGKKVVPQKGPVAVSSTPQLPPTQTTTPQAVIRPPVTNPPPPPIPLKYPGYFVVNSPGGNLIAILDDGVRHYNVTVGEVLMGRFRITQISDKSVEVEDLEYNRRQAIPLTKP